MIKQVRITNFKSLSDVSVKLDPVTVLIGRSGSGKTNFVDALRWLRDYLKCRDDQEVQKLHGGWERVMSLTSPHPMSLSFQVTFDAPGVAGEFTYSLAFRQPEPGRPPLFADERLSLAGQDIFRQRDRSWAYPPPVANPPSAGAPVLGTLTGLPEANLAHVVLTTGIGCYAFPDSVLRRVDPPPDAQSRGLADDGRNFLQVFAALHDNPQTWQHPREIVASMRLLRPSLTKIDLRMPGRDQVLVTHKFGDRPLTIDVSQESEGLRRVLACLLAMYQLPPKQTLIFDEPEKGVYPAGLAILAEEFKSCPAQGRGQVLLTTHSPEFLQHFNPEQIRVVQMRDSVTQIGLVAPEQMEALREHCMEPKELLTVDEARLEETLSGAP